jgi:CBS domain containing-hemolysin-like protein
MNWVDFIPLIIIILFLGFFSGIETVFISANKLSLELRKKQGSYSGSAWSDFTGRPGHFMVTLLIILNFLLVTCVLFWTRILSDVWETWGIDNIYIKLVAEILVLAFILILIESLFKAFFRAKENTITGSSLITFIVKFFYYFFSWMAQYFVNIAEWILKYFFNVKIQNKTDTFIRTELNYYVQQLKMSEADENSEMNTDLFENVLSLSETRVRECLIPRKEIKAITIDASIEDIKNHFLETGLSKLVVFENNIDNIKGYIHQLDMFKNPESLRSVLISIPVIPESMNATDLINKFTKEKKSIAWVIDEFGGTSGIVTMEDLLEEIFGDIYDEFDVQQDLIDKQIAPNEYLFSGRLELDYLTERYQLNFRKNEEAETLSGYIINFHGSIPREKDRIILDDYQFDILKVIETRIETVKLKVLK